MSVWLISPRLGTLPRGSENVSVSSVRLISRTFSLGMAGGAGETGLGNRFFPPALFGRNIKLRPVPAKVPAKLDKTPSVGGATGGATGVPTGPPTTKGANPELAELSLAS